MEYLHNGFTLELAESSFPLSTDSIALSAFARLPKNASVLDLGSGCGTLGLLLCADHPDCSVTGIEMSEADHNAALDNARRNGVQGRLKSICDNLCRVPEIFTPGSFQICISNPPYFSGGFKSQSVPDARHNHACPTDTLFRSAAWALQYGGDFYLVHKPEMLANLCYHAGNCGLEPKRLLMIRHTPQSPVSLILLQCRKGGKPGLILEEAVLRTQSGEPSDYYKKLYHL